MTFLTILLCLTLPINYPPESPKGCNGAKEEQNTTAKS